MGLRTRPRNPEVRTAQPTPRRASGECSDCQDPARAPNNAASPAQRAASSQPCGQRALGRLAGAPVSLGTTGRLPHAAVRQLGHTSHSVAYHGPPAREAKQQPQRTSLGLREPGAWGEALGQKGGDSAQRSRQPRPTCSEATTPATVRRSSTYPRACPLAPRGLRGSLERRPTGSRGAEAGPPEHTQPAPSQELWGLLHRQEEGSGG